MGTKRRVQSAEPDFQFLQKYMSYLAKYNSADARSFLLLIKSLMPNSLKLKLIEYGFAKDNGDAVNAAQHLSHLCTGHRDSLRDEVESLFRGIECTPPDRMSIDIFTRLAPTAQRDTLSIYFEHSPGNLSKVDTLMRLLDVAEIRSQTQLVPTLLALASDTLRNGEQLLCPIMVEKVSQAGTIKKQSSPIVKPKDPKDATPRSDDADESEEGEVTGDDEDEDEELEEDSATSRSRKTGDVADKKSLINIFRLKKAYSLLPIIHKVHRTSKIDKKLLDEVATSTLSFLFNYLSTVPEDDAITGSDEKITDLCAVHPKTYLSECVLMIGDLFQWPRTVCSTACSSSLMTPDRLFQIVTECIGEIDHCSSTIEPASKRRRKSDSHHLSHIKSLCHQSACLFWFMFIEFSTKHLRQYRKNLFTQSSRNETSFYPIHFHPLHTTDVNKSVVPSEPRDSDPSIILLSHLWRLREKITQSSNDSLGMKELKNTLSKFAPYPPPFGEVFLESIITTDLALLNHNNASQATPDQVKNTIPIPASYADNDRNLVQWISSAYSINALHRTEWSENSRRAYFIQQLPIILTLAHNQDETFVHLDSDYWMLPFTRSSVGYFGCKVISQWLCDLFNNGIDTERAPLSYIVCLLTVLCQIDSTSSLLLSKRYPLPITAILTAAKDNWCETRQTLLPWLEASPPFIMDAGLLNWIAQRESEYRVGQANTNDIQQSNLMDACVQCLKKASTDGATDRLCAFIESESTSIIKCLQTDV